MGIQRNLSSEEILYILIDLREKAKEYVGIDTEIVINKEACKEIGLFNYTIKETGEVRVSRLFLISETHDGEVFNIIYDDKGKFIGWQNQEDQENNRIQVARDIELKEQQLTSQLIRGEARTRMASEGSSSSDTAKAGEGRDLANKEHEEDKKEEKEESLDNGQKDTLTNLKGVININYQPKIKLNEIINGYYLWEILQIENRLKGRLPEGVSEKSFRNGYLTIIDSKELEAKDGKERKTQDTFAICTYSGDIIELDEQILEPSELGTREEQKQSEQSNLRYADGKESEKPDTDMDLARTSLYKIPKASENFNVNENWFLAVDKNREWLENGTIPATGNTKEISFVQKSRNDSYYAREERVKGTLEYKLEAINESPMNKKELKQAEQLREKDANETENIRGEHITELVERCFVIYPSLQDYYNKNDIKEKVEKYHNSGMDDKEIVEQIGKDAKCAEEIEHEFYRHGGSRKH